MKCGGIEHVKHMRAENKPRVAVAPAYNKMAAATIVPLASANQFPRCAPAPGDACGPNNNDKVRRYRLTSG